MARRSPAGLRCIARGPGGRMPRPSGAGPGCRRPAGGRESAAPLSGNAGRRLRAAAREAMDAPRAL